MTSTYEARLATYKNWPWSPFSIEALAEVGFRHTSHGNVQCSQCHLQFDQWGLHSNDGFTKEHRRLAEECSLAQELMQASKEETSASASKSSKSSSSQSTSPSSAPAKPFPKLLFNHKPCSPQNSSAMTASKPKLTTYEERLATFSNWSHNIPTSKTMTAAGWYHCPTKRWPDLVKGTHCTAIVTFRMDFEEEEDLLDIHLKISSFCSLASKALKTLKKQQEENELKALQTASSKSISAAEVPAPRAPLHTPLSTILPARTPKSSIFDASPIPSLTPSHMQGLLSSTYEKRLATFKAWPHQLPTSTSLAAAGFCYETGTKDLTTCSECGLALADWKPKRNPFKAHLRQSPNCPFAQALSKEETSASNSAKTSSLQATSLSSVSMKPRSEPVTQSASELTAEEAIQLSIIKQRAY